MTVFKSFWQIVLKNIGIIILYTVLLISFGTINFKSNNETNIFVDSKPSIVIIDNDNTLLSKDLKKYLKKYTNIKDITNESDIDDAIFYRDVSYVIYIPNNFESATEIKVKSSDTYESFLASSILNRYLKAKDIYSFKYHNEKLIEKINETLESDVNVQINSKINKSNEEKISRFFNFSSYSLMAITIYIICLVSSSYNQNIIQKKVLIGKLSVKKHNFYLMLSSIIFAVLIWFIYVILSLIVLKDLIFNIKGLLYILNMLVYVISAFCLAMLLSKFAKSKGAISGVVNVISLCQAFLCGAFIPVIWLPKKVINLSKIFIAHYFVNSNDYLSSLENITILNLKTYFINIFIMLIFTLLFIIINNLLTLKYSYKN